VLPVYINQKLGQSKTRSVWPSFRGI